ncbi:unnamed protein product, partial [Didymodactylos carnosus]
EQHINSTTTIQACPENEVAYDDQCYYLHGSDAHCNKHGPFTEGPENRNGCINQTNQHPRQTTFCGSH